MAIKVSGVNVIDNERNANAGVVTATSLDVDPVATTFSPTDGSSDVSLTSNIVITYNTSIAAGSGNITLRDGSASGTVIETIDVTSGSVSISGGEVTINPSDFPTGKDIYVVVDEGAFVQSNAFLNGSSGLLNTYNFTTGPITVSAFSPSDGSTNFSVSQNIAIYFSENISKGSGNITIRSGSASGTVQQTIDVTSSAVTLGSGGTGHIAFIDPPSDLAYITDTYIVVDAGCFRNADGDVASGNAIINTYNFTTESDFPTLGGEGEGGYLICMSGGNYWIVAPSAAAVSRTWYSRNDAVTRAQQVSGCSTGWFVPSYSQAQNPGVVCRQYWDSIPYGRSYTNEPYNSACACTIYYPNGDFKARSKDNSCDIRAFRCLSY